MRVFRTEIVEADEPGWYRTEWSLFDRLKMVMWWPIVDRIVERMRPRWLERLDAFGREDYPDFQVPADFWACEDCSWPTRPFEQYMVTDEVWRLAVPADEDRCQDFFLCVECLEDRLDRGLVADDFIACLMNDDPEQPCSTRLHDRKSRRAAPPADPDDIVDVERVAPTVSSPPAAAKTRIAPIPRERAGDPEATKTRTPLQGKE